MKKRLSLSLGVVFAALLLSGCQLIFLDYDSMISTKVAEAVDERLAEIEAAYVDEAHMAEAVVPPVPTPYPTYTPYPTQVSQTYVTYDYSYVIGTPGGCLNAIFVSENIPDNTVFSPGDAFIKEWTIQNTGDCTWNTNYRLVFFSGSSMGGDISSYLIKSVAPGENITLTANLTAPSSDGIYKGEWRVQSDTGINFARFWVQIEVD